MSDRPRRDTSRSRSRRRSRSASRRRRRHRLHEHCHERTYESDQELAGAADGSEQLKLANREHVAARARMWTVVDSDRSGSDAESDAATTTKTKKKKRRRRETSSHGRDRRRRRDRSSSASSAAESKSSDSSDSSDTSEDERVQRKRRHKSRRSKDDKKKKKKKEKKEKKRKKDGGRKLAVDQDEYGKYGILRESDFHRKSVSFHAWLRDVKKMGAFNGPKWEAMELFKEYMEDYNTCTMPHKKYYDIEKYEMEQYQKQQRKAFDKQKKASSVKALDAVADEERVRRERLDARGKKEQEEFRLVLQLMDKDKIEAMREQERLRSQMQLMYKSGNVGEARRLEQILNKVEEDPRFKR
ncbi:unnamed protein product [Hyaloperonospora brassicae]|uniref:Uncharacterized protein n=1 Tax=Hyaloperonospora brassicae TaxID=162125 RepID=A0AAV0U9A0_HYABA|nr:unnamed protein product [Hyaloperonospora brassicae]